MSTGITKPRTAVIVGAGMTGLATAWHLQYHGVEVTVLDREGVAAGSSWGNAGWLTPGMAMPLADPSLLTYGPKALMDPSAPLHIPARLDPRLWAFLARFRLRATNKDWASSMAALTPIDTMALAAFDELGANGVAAPTREGSFVVAFEGEKASHHFLHELRQVEKAGQVVPVNRLADPRTVPQLSDRLSTVYTVEGQRFIEPGPYVESLADSVRARGGRIVSGARVTSVQKESAGVVVEIAGQERIRADVAVLASGAWLPELSRGLGVRTMVQAGRGYSFSVATDRPAESPIYFPASRVACTPYRGRLRVAGTMEFRRPDEPLQRRRVHAIVASVRPLLSGVDLDDLQDVWVGSRPMTPDGLPVLGAPRGSS